MIIRKLKMKTVIEKKRIQGTYPKPDSWTPKYVAPGP